MLSNHYYLEEALLTFHIVHYLNRKTDYFLKRSIIFLLNQILNLQQNNSL